MSNLYVIRHAQVDIDPGVPPADWRLSRAGTREEWQSIALPDLSVVCTKSWTVQSGFLADARQ